MSGCDAMLVTGLLLLVACAALSKADIPVHCLQEDIEGKWIFWESPRNEPTNPQCDTLSTTLYDFTQNSCQPNIIKLDCIVTIVTFSFKFCVFVVGGQYCEIMLFFHIVQFTLLWGTLDGLQAY